jgi:hypothetical protein
MRAVKGPLQRPGILVVLVVACGLMCCAACVVAGFISEALDDFPRVLLDTKVTLQPAGLCAGSHEEWVHVASRLLSERGWGPSGRLTRLRGHLLRGSPSSLSTLDFEFTKVEFATVIPHLKVASVGLDCSTGIASVRIEDRGPVTRRHTPMDPSEVAVGLQEAVVIAEAHGGQAVREQLGSACLIVIVLSDYEWQISYLDKAISSQPALTVKVNARSGQVNTEN